MNLETLIENGYITRVKHPTEELFILNYTNKTQYENFWNEHTLTCRGLIVDSEKRIIQRPFKKFFNYEQLESIPTGNFKVYEKLDGQLGILYWVNDAPYIATRGSFSSDYAIYASQNLVPKYDFTGFDRSKTYLFEIIYPAGRIVVDYKGREDLVLLACIDTETGAEIDIDTINFPFKAKRFDGLNDYESIKALENKTDEGFVLLFDNGERVKIKFNEYKRLHRILTNVSSRTIWEYLKDKKDFNEIIDRVPDEFHSWVAKTKDSLIEEFNSIYNESLKNAQEVRALGITDERILAEKIKQYPRYDYVFALYKGKNIDEKIWRLIKPEYTKAFIEDEI